jgi:tetratricopeptide (TPR) repeat protein
MFKPGFVLSVLLAVAGLHPGGATGVRTESARAQTGSPAAETSELSDSVEPRAPFNPRAILDLLYINRPDSALSVLESFHRANARDPYPLLLQAKVLRERMNDEDHNRENIRRSTTPIHAVLDSAIAISDEALERDVKDYKHYYYRGYGWLSKAQLYVLTKGFWSAGRAASRGKDDLEKYLEKYPDDADARGALGAYYYFADAIPGFVKIVAKLLLIPGGDRERGLDMMRFAATHDGAFSVDWRFVMAAVDLVFEGHFEKGTEELIELLRQYPCYTRLAEPIVVVAPLYPARLCEIDSLVESAVATQLSFDEGKVDLNLVKRIRVMQAFADSYFGSPREAVERYTALINDPPDYPDWVLAIALLNRGYLQQRQGAKDDAKRAFDAVRSDKRMNRYHHAAETMSSSLNGSIQTIDPAEFAFVPRIYQGDPEQSRQSLAQWKQAHGESAIFDFYSGEIEALGGSFDEARRAYDRALTRDAAGGEQIYQALAAVRIAELLGADGKYSEAREFLGRAAGFCHANYLLDFLIEARSRFYQLVDDGKLDAKPCLLSRGPHRT